MKWVWLLVTCMSGVLHAADTFGPSLHAEVSRLESQSEKSYLSATERQRLMQIYFLTSECDKIKALTKKIPYSHWSQNEKDMVCACHGKCDMTGLGRESSFQTKLYTFQQLLTGGVRLQDPQVQNLWRILRDSPEARYVLFQVLKDSPVPAERKLAYEQFETLKNLNFGY